jgi:hypothetical protein
VIGTRHHQGFWESEGGIPYCPRWRWGYRSDIWTSNYTQGCVMADVIDPTTNEVVWRGVVKDTNTAIDQCEKQTDQAVKDLVKKFIKDPKKVLQEESVTVGLRHICGRAHRSSRHPLAECSIPELISSVVASVVRLAQSHDPLLEHRAYLAVALARY